MTKSKARIAIVLPGKPTGGVKTIINKFAKGLHLEGFCVELLKWSHPLISDMKNISKLYNFDIVVYASSLPLPSHIFVSNNVRTVLFVHSYFKYQNLLSIKYGK